MVLLILIPAFSCLLMFVGLTELRRWRYVPAVTRAAAMWLALLACKVAVLGPGHRWNSDAAHVLSEYLPALWALCADAANVDPPYRRTYDGLFHFCTEVVNAAALARLVWTERAWWRARSKTPWRWVGLIHCATKGTGILSSWLATVRCGMLFALTRPVWNDERMARLSGLFGVAWSLSFPGLLVLATRELFVGNEAMVRVGALMHSSWWSYPLCMVFSCGTCSDNTERWLRNLLLQNLLVEANQYANALLLAMVLLTLTRTHRAIAGLFSLACRTPSFVARALRTAYGACVFLSTEYSRLWGTSVRIRFRYNRTRFV